MNEQEAVRIRNIRPWWMTQVLIIIVPFTGLILVAGFVFREMLFSIVFSAVNVLSLVLLYMAFLRETVEVVVSPHCIQLINRRGKRKDISWKNVIMLVPVPQNLDLHNLTYFKESGKKALEILSKEPAEEVESMWKTLFPDARDLDDDPERRRLLFHGS